MSTQAAIVLAGGAGRRMGGVAKPLIRLGGSTLLERVLGAAICSGVTDVVVVGAPTGVAVGAPTGVAVGAPARAACRVRFVREQPPGGGPVAALSAGLAAVDVPAIFLLAGDLPFLNSAALRCIAVAAAGHDGAVATDDSGRDQPLLSAWSTMALRGALPAEAAGASLRAVLTRLSYVRVPLDGSPPPWFDCDSPEELATAQRWLADDPG